MPLNLLYECCAFKLRKESRYLLSTEIYMKRSKLMFSNLGYTLSLLKFFLHFLMVPTFQYFGWVFFFVCSFVFSELFWSLFCITMKRRVFFAKQLGIVEADSRFLYGETLYGCFS